MQMEDLRSLLVACQDKVQWVDKVDPVKLLKECHQAWAQMVCQLAWAWEVAAVL